LEKIARKQKSYPQRKIFIPSRLTRFEAKLGKTAKKKPKIWDMRQKREKNAVKRESMTAHISPKSTKVIHISTNFYTIYVVMWVSL
jgi:hypothetical protein